MSRTEKVNEGGKEGEEGGTRDGLYVGQSPERARYVARFAHARTYTRTRRGHQASEQQQHSQQLHHVGTRSTSTLPTPQPLVTRFGRTCTACGSR